MITQYNVKYDELFAKASNALGTDPLYTVVTIDSAEQFQKDMIDGIRYFIKTDDTYTEVPDGQEFNAELTYYIVT